MRSFSSLLCAAVLASAACQSGSVDGGADSNADGELNYFSTDAIEYYFEGSSFVEIEDELAGASDEAKLARAQQLTGLKTIAIGWFLFVRLSPRELTLGELGDPNRETYPGYGGIVRTGDWSITNLHPLGDGKRYGYTVKLQAAGAPDMLDKLPGTRLAGGKKAMPLAMGKISNEDLARVDPGSQWFRDPQWRTGTFDPTKMSPADLETMTLTVYPEPRSSDAYLDLGKLYADGKLTIDAHYGYDYLDGWDIANSASLYKRLIEQGFTSPASGYETYVASMGPLVKRYTLGGKPVQVEVRIFHGASQGYPGPDMTTDEGGMQMERDMRDSLAHSDAILFSGHSGQYYGFALANWNATRAGQFDFAQLSSVDMPRDQYQIVLASGCETFSIGQAFAENPNKQGLRNLNVITTNGWAQAGWNKDLEAVFDALYSDDPSFDPQPISGLLTRMNRASALDEMYGLHGIDGNPKRHPFARVDLLGRSCSADADCGGPGNRCTKSGASRVCSASCTDDTGCPASYHCKAVAAGVQKQCLFAP